MQFPENTREGLFRFCPEAKTRELVVQNADDELLIYDLQTNRAVCLNQTAALVWQSCDGKTDLKTITGELEKSLQNIIDPDLVLLALKQLNEVGLIENGKSIPKDFSHLSRREVVKKIGLGSLVALPIVSAIVAPQAVNAQSGTCFNPTGLTPGSTWVTPANPGGTTCLSDNATLCLTMVCANDPFALANCQSCMGTLQPMGGDFPTTCNPACTCICA